MSLPSPRSMGASSVLVAAASSAPSPSGFFFGCSHVGYGAYAVVVVHGHHLDALGGSAGLADLAGLDANDRRAPPSR